MVALIEVAKYSNFYTGKISDIFNVIVVSLLILH